MATEQEREELITKVMEKIEHFYFEDGSDCGEVIFNKFAAKHEKTFEEDFEAKDGENKLEYTEAYNEFCKIFEQHIERIIQECNITVDQFYQAIKTAQEKNEDAKFYLEILMSVTDYENFVGMMKYYKRDQLQKSQL